jgi:hypothetical protein
MYVEEICRIKSQCLNKRFLLSYIESMYTYFTWILRKIITLYLVYYHNLVGIYGDVTLRKVSVLHIIITVYRREVTGEYRKDET